MLPLLYAYQLQAQVLVKHHTYINFHFIAIIVDDDDVVDVYAQCKYDDSLRELCYVSENYLHKNVEEKWKYSQGKNEVTQRDCLELV